MGGFSIFILDDRFVEARGFPILKMGDDIFLNESPVLDPDQFKEGRQSRQLLFRIASDFAKSLVGVKGQCDRLDACRATEFQSENAVE